MTKRINTPTDHVAPSPPLVLVAICGGVAAYKTVEVVSRLRQRGCDVHVVMSEAGTRFVTPMTFAAVSGNRVLTDQFPDAEQQSGDDLYPHLYPATRADLFLVMPATADMLSRLAQGAGTEIVSTCALSLPPAARRLICPSMNVEMWEQASVQENVRTLEQRGWERIGPGSGTLACGMEGAGRVAEPAEVIERVCARLQARMALEGKRVLIFSGPTHEHLDPVRYIGNRSSGRMGKALAEEAASRGASVTLISGPIAREHLPRSPQITIRSIVSAQDMLEAGQEEFPEADLIMYAAAVADYRPARMETTKTEKTKGDWALALTPTSDIAATLSATRKPHQVCIGFALQSGDGVAEAKAKLERKGLDAILLNHPESMGADEAAFTYISRDAKNEERWGVLNKRACAAKLLESAEVLFR